MNDDWQLNVNKLIDYAGKTHGDSQVVSSRILQGGKTHRLNYRTVSSRVSAVSAQLKALGIKPGDRIAVLGWNDHRYFELYFAISGIGAVMLQLNLRLNPDEVTYILDHSRARALFVDDSLLNLAEILSSKHKFDFVVVLSDGKVDTTNQKLGVVYSYEYFVERGSELEFQWEDIDEKSAATACYTSGTTGLPKGVYYSHRSLILHTWSIAQASGMNVNDTLLQIVPLFHANGWGIHMAAAMSGSKVVFPGRYTPESLTELLLQEKVTVTVGVPTILSGMAQALEKKGISPDLSNLRIISGGSEPPLALMKTWMGYGAKFVHAYGATETTPLATVNHPKMGSMSGLSDDVLMDYKRKQGYSTFGVDLKLVGPDGKEVAHDGKTAGEIWLRGPWIIRKYHEDKRTEEQCTPEGWWRSGDVGTVDQFGYLKIMDRIKDVIKSGGEWISSVDLENFLVGHPVVLEAAVVGIPHQKWDERPLAFIVLRKDYSGDEREKLKEELKEFLSKKFVKWQVPDDFLFVGEIPKTSVGKIAKRVLRDQYSDFYTKSGSKSAV